MLKFIHNKKKQRQKVRKQMTREEALRRVKGYLTDIIPAEDYSEVEEIVQALEQEPHSDTISRKAVYEQINCWIGSGEYRYTNATYYLMKRIRDIPSVT